MASQKSIPVTCHTCSKTFLTWPYVAKRPRIYCSRACAWKRTHEAVHIHALKRRQVPVQPRHDRWRLVPTNSGKSFKVSLVDFEEMSNMVWTDSHRYVTSGKAHGLIPAHRLVLEAKLGRSLGEGEMPDHVNADTYDNRRENLRLAVSWQNNANRAKSSANRSGYKGVSWDAQTSRWRATICANGTVVRLGRYQSRDEAAWMVDQFAMALQGEFARINLLYK